MRLRASHSSVVVVREAAGRGGRWKILPVRRSKIWRGGSAGEVEKKVVW